VRIPPLPFSLKAPRLLQPLTLVAALVVVLLMSSLGWADSCSAVSLTLNGPPVTCAIPEQTLEVMLNTTLTGLGFKAQAGGMVLIFDTSDHTLPPSDVVVFTNTGGVATVTFLSDTDLAGVTGSGLPILGQFTESNKPISISLALTNGNFLNVKICSDLGESTTTCGGSDSISLSEGGTSAVPEPGTLLLLGSGLFGSGALKVSATSLRRRLLKWRQS